VVLRDLVDRQRDAAFRRKPATVDYVVWAERNNWGGFVDQYAFGHERNDAVGRMADLRLFLMPFCVSSFAAIVKDVGYILIFPPTLTENAIGAGAIALFLLAIRVLRCALPREERDGTALRRHR
jgi:hypothetical protein